MELHSPSLISFYVTSYEPLACFHIFNVFISAEKYCELVVSENGVEKLRALLASPSSIEAVNTLAETTIKTVTTYFGMA